MRFKMAIVRGMEFVLDVARQDEKLGVAHLGILRSPSRTSGPVKCGQSPSL
jgi:hypothetical protein